MLIKKNQKVAGRASRCVAGSGGGGKEGRIRVVIKRNGVVGDDSDGEIVRDGGGDPEAIAPEQFGGADAGMTAATDLEEEGIENVLPLGEGDLAVDHPAEQVEVAFFFASRVETGTTPWHTENPLV